MNASTAIVNTITTTTPKVFTISSESVFTIPRSGVHLSSESVFIFRRNSHRHALASTLITSQYPVSQWHELIGEATLADAILDRLIHNAHRLELHGESMRKRLGQGNDSNSH